MNMGTITACVAVVFVAGSIFFAARAMILSSHATHQAHGGTVGVEELMKEFDAKRKDIARKNEQIEQDVEQLCKHIREKNLTSDSASLGYIASGRTKASYRLAEELYNLREEVKSNVGEDKKSEFCKLVDDRMYEVAVAQEELLMKCNARLDEACSGG